MNVPAKVNEALPALIQRAADALLSARTHGEVLEAKHMASAAYDGAKSAGRIAKAKGAHDAILAQVHRAQADALMIEARAKMRLADEYDLAQERGDVATGRDGPGAGVKDHDAKATAADLGMHREHIREARQLRDAEAADPGVVERTVNEAVERGEEPTKAKVKRAAAEALGKAAPTPVEAEADPFEKYRREWRKLTPEAREDDYCGLRAEVAELRVKLEEAEHRAELAEERMAFVTADDNMGRKLGEALRQNDTMRGRMNDHMRTAKRLEYILKTKGFDAKGHALNGAARV